MSNVVNVITVSLKDKEPVDHFDAEHALKNLRVFYNNEDDWLTMETELMEAPEKRLPWVNTIGISKVIGVSKAEDESLNIILPYPHLYEGVVVRLLKELAVLFNTELTAFSKTPYAWVGLTSGK